MEVEGGVVHFLSDMSIMAMFNVNFVGFLGGGVGGEALEVYNTNGYK